MFVDFARRFPNRKSHIPSLLALQCVQIEDINVVLPLFLFSNVNDSKHSVHLMTWYSNCMPTICVTLSVPGLSRNFSFHLRSLWFCRRFFFFTSQAFVFFCVLFWISIFVCHLPTYIFYCNFSIELKKLSVWFDVLPFNSLTFSTRASLTISNNRPERW